MPSVSASSPQARKLRDLIRDVKFAMLTTRAIDGSLTSRPMTTLQAEFDGTLWFIAAADSLAAADIDARPKVSLGYAAPEDGRYVAVSGTAEVVRDPAKARELWNPLFTTWFPAGPDDRNLALVKVEVTAADYWESPMGRSERLLEEAEQGDRSLLGQHVHVDVNTAAAEGSGPDTRC